MGIRERLLQQIDRQIAPLERELKVELPRQLAEAAAHGDLSENAEHEAAKQRRELVEARLAQLYRRKAALSALNPRMIARDAIGFWSRVVLQDLVSGEQLTYRLVSADEADPRQGKISLTSPIGMALLGRRAGDEVTVETPRGTKSYAVLEFTTIHEEPELI